MYERPVSVVIACFMEESQLMTHKLILSGSSITSQYIYIWDFQVGFLQASVLPTDDNTKSHPANY